MKYIYLSFLFVFFVFTENINAQQLIEDFESGYPPIGWTEDTGAVDVMNVSTNYYLSPTTSFFFDDINGHDTSFFITSQITSLSPNSQLTFYQLERYPTFYIYHGVWISTTGTDRGSFVELSEVTFDEANVWEYASVDLSAYAGQDIYLAFVYEGDYADEWYLEDVKVDLIPSCPAPLSLSVSGIDGVNVEFEWNSDSVQSFLLEYGEPGFDLGSGTVVEASEPPYTLTGLDEATQYEIYVSAVCAVGDTSDASLATSFITGCDTIIATRNLPFSEDFETAVTPELPCDWLSSNNNNDTEEWITEWDGLNQYAIMPYNASLNANDWLISPPISLNDSDLFEFTFDLSADFGGYTDKLLVAVGTTPDSSGLSQVLLDTAYVSSGALEEISLYFSVDQNTEYYIGFYVYSDPDQGSVIIDNINLDVAPSCINPNSVLASASMTDVSLSWSDLSGAMEWVIEYDTAGFDFGTGMTMVVDTNDYTLSGLMEQYTYEFYVTAVCSSNDTSSASGPVSVTTGCNPSFAVLSIPFMEDFEDMTAPFISCDWTNLNQNQDVEKWRLSDSGVDKYPFLRWNTEEASDDWLITPGLSLQSGVVYEITFDWGSFSSVNWVEKFKVAYGPFADPNTLTEVILDTTFIGQGNLVTSTFYFTPDQTANYYFGFYGYSDLDQGGLAIDNIAIEEAPSCIEPTNLMAETEGTTVTLSWSDISGATSWMVEYDTAGFQQGNGISMIINSNPYVLPGLEEQTNYDFYISAICGPGDTSLWAGPLSVATECEPSTVVESVPYMEDFEMMAVPFIDCDWTVINQNNDGIAWRTIFDNVSNVAFMQWNSNLASDDWLITPSIALTSGSEYVLSFDWGSYSADYWMDNFKVAYGIGNTPNDLTMELMDTTFVGTGALESISFNITPSVTGNYNFGFYVYSNPDQGGVAIDNVSVDIVTSSKTIGSGELSVYPNPATDHIFIESNNELVKEVLIKDMLGKTLKVVNETTTINNIDISSLPVGTYLIEIETENTTYINQVVKK